MEIVDNSMPTINIHVSDEDVELTKKKCQQHQFVDVVDIATAMFSSLNILEHSPPKSEVDFENIPSKLQTSEMCMIAINENILNFFHVRSDLQTQEMVEKAFVKIIGIFKYIRKDLQTREMVKKALEQDINNFICVRDDLQTTEICEHCVRKNIRLFNSVRKDLQTTEMCLLISNNDIPNIRPDLMTPELCVRLLHKNINSFFYIDERFRTPELCMILIRQSIDNIIHVGKINTDLLMMMLNDLPIPQIITLIKTRKIDKALFMNSLFMSTDAVKEKYASFINSCH